MAKNQNNNVAPATQKTEPGAKKDALATALAQIEKQFGKGAIMKLGDNTAMQVDAISYRQPRPRSGAGRGRCAPRTYHRGVRTGIQR